MPAAPLLCTCCCSQVIAQLNDKNEDSDADFHEIAEQYEKEIEQIFKETAGKINTFKSKLEDARDEMHLATIQQVRWLKKQGRHRGRQRVYGAYAQQRSLMSQWVTFLAHRVYASITAKLQMLAPPQLQAVLECAKQTALCTKRGRRSLLHQHQCCHGIPCLQELGAKYEEQLKKLRNELDGVRRRTADKEAAIQKAASKQIDTLTAQVQQLQTTVQQLTRQLEEHSRDDKSKVCAGGAGGCKD